MRYRSPEGEPPPRGGRRSGGDGGRLCSRGRGAARSSALSIVRPAAASGNIELGSLCACCRATTRALPLAGSVSSFNLPGAMLQPPVEATATPPPTSFPRFSAARQVAAPLRKNGSHCIRFRIKCMTWFYYANAIRNRCHGSNLPVKIAFNYPSGITTLSFPSGTRLLLLLGWRRPATAAGRKSSAVEPEASARDATPAGRSFLVSTALAPACKCAIETTGSPYRPCRRRRRSTDRSQRR